MNEPTLRIVIGTAGTGKSTIARRLARQHAAAYLDKDAMSARFVEAALLAAGYDPGDRESNAFYRERILPLEYDSLLDVAGVDVSAHAAAGEDRWLEDGVAALVRFDNGHSGVLVAARDAGGWSEKLDAYGNGASANVTAPDRIDHPARRDDRAGNVARGLRLGDGDAEVRLRRSGSPFPGPCPGPRYALDVRDDAAKTQLLLDRILAVAGLATDEQPGRVWSSHAKK